MSNILNNSKELIVLEMANNHQGDLQHAKKIINEFSKFVDKYKETFSFAMKFQYRDLDSFIHPNFKNSDLKFVQRFETTKLSDDEFLELKNYCTNKGFISMCTPFDETSVKKVIDHEYDILKIASASFDDWPLLTEIVKHKPNNLIASVGGADFDKIKRFYSFMTNNNINFAINYCVSLYPSTDEDLNLSFISKLKSEFTDIRIGFSTHENPSVVKTAGLALHAGATIFEKHVALEDSSKEYYQNAYSVYPEQFSEWIENLFEAKTFYGNSEKCNKVIEKELPALKPLQRGAFVKKEIKKGDLISNKNTFFAIPTDENQITANDFSKFNEIKSTTNIKNLNPISSNNVNFSSTRNTIEEIREKVSIEFKKYNIVIPSGIEMEISHHYGVESFYNFGTVMCTLINKDYCKKVLYQFPDQHHPEHFHKIKEETFILLQGDLTVILNGKSHAMVQGDILTIEREAKHEFYSKNGAIFEEISTAHLKDDSYYSDNEIMLNQNRKSKITFI